jgi:nucleoside phosphorylase
MLGILFATEEEAKPFMRRYKRGRFEGLSEGETFHDDDVLVSLLGIGKIKASLRTERLLNRYRLSRILHAGTCVALSDDYKAGQLVYATQVFEGDRIELSAPSYPRMPLESPTLDLPRANLVTQDHAISGETEVTYWQRIANVIDTTGYAVAYVAGTHGVPCNIVKAVTGFTGVEEHSKQENVFDVGTEALAAFLLKEIEASRED